MTRRKISVRSAAPAASLAGGDDLIGATGNGYFYVKTPLAPTWLRAEAVETDPQELARWQRECGLPPMTPTRLKAFRAASEYLHEGESFPELDVVDRPGRHGSRFVLPSGKVRLVAGASKPELGFRSQPDVFRSAGSFRAYRGMLDLVRDEPMSVCLLNHALSAVMQSFVPLPEVPLAWVSGGPNTCKTVRARLAASTAGVPDRVVLPFAAMLDDAQAIMRSRSGSVLIADDLRLGIGGKKRGGGVEAVASNLERLSSGRVDDPYGACASAPVALASVIVSNHMPGHHLTGMSYAEQASVLDRTMTFPSDVFSLDPALAEPLARLTSANHGLIISGFARRMLRMFHREPQTLMEGIARRQAEFRKLVRSTTPLTGTERIVDHFGRLYVNGALAAHWGLYPEAFGDPNAPLQCLQAHRNVLSPLTPIEQIYALADDPDIITLSDYRRQSMTDEELAAKLFLREHDGYVELVMTRGKFIESFAYPALIERDPAVNRIRVQEPGRDTIQVRVRSNSDKDRMLCFRLYKLPKT